MCGFGERGYYSKAANISLPGSSLRWAHNAPANERNFHPTLFTTNTNDVLVMSLCKRSHAIRCSREANCTLRHLVYFSQSTNTISKQSVWVIESFLYLKQSVSRFLRALLIGYCTLISNIILLMCRFHDSALNYIYVCYLTYLRASKYGAQQPQIHLCVMLTQALPQHPPVHLKPSL